MSETNDEGFTTIQVRKTTRDRINDLRKGSETQDEFLRKLMDEVHPPEPKE